MVTMAIENVGAVFEEFKGRRDALIKALTDDQEKFYQQCDPEKENLCLYGFTNGQWEVNVPSEEVPPELPEPVLGINFARDGMERKAWLSLVAVHCDCWLKAVAYYLGASVGFKKNERKMLFDLINDLPTVFDVVNMEPKDNLSNSNPSNSKSSKNVQPRKSEQPEAVKMTSEVEEEEDEENEQDATMCGACSKDYADDNTEEFWICCDMCERWFHGKCVKVTPKRAANIKKYMCPDCSINKRAKV